LNPTFIVSAFFLGLLGSTHCVAMCGGIVTMLSSSNVIQLGRARKAPSLTLALAYNGGRALSYASAGALAGAFGLLANRVELLSGVQVGLRFIAGVMMVCVGLYLAGVWKKLGAVEKLGAPLWSRIEPVAKRLLPVQGHGSAFALGALWGFLPCGLVYAALGAALGTGTARDGALTMAAFFMGTLPSLLAVSAFTQRLSGLVRRPWIRRVAGIGIVLFGLVNVQSAAALSGFSGSNRDACCPQPHGNFHAGVAKK
jgi:sulfite exporter TauE/SafE